MTERRRANRSHVSYMDKSREYYAASGYEKPYTWATNDEAPFAPLAKPLSESKIGVVTTSYFLPDGFVYKVPGDLPRGTCHRHARPGWQHRQRASVLGEGRDQHRRSQHLPPPRSARTVGGRRPYRIAVRPFLLPPDAVQPTSDPEARCPSDPGVDAGGRHRCRAPRSPLTRLPPVRESGRKTPRSSRNPHRRDRFGTRHRRGMRSCSLRIRRLPTRQSLWQTRRPCDAGSDRRAGAGRARAGIRATDNRAGTRSCGTRPTTVGGSASCTSATTIGQSSPLPAPLDGRNRSNDGRCSRAVNRAQLWGEVRRPAPLEVSRGIGCVPRSASRSALRRRRRPRRIGRQGGYPDVARPVSRASRRWDARGGGGPRDLQSGHRR